LGFKWQAHKNEIMGREYTERDSTEYQFIYKTSSEPFYPFDGLQGRTSKSCMKRYPFSGAIYFDELRPLF
jgi:hypothetical protein